MKNTIAAIAFIYLLCVAEISNAQSSSFQKVFNSGLYTVYGTSSFHEPGVSAPSPEQIICFSAQVATPGKFDIAILKIDSAGTVVNNKMLTKNPSFHDWTRDFIKLGSNYYMTGSSRAFDTSTFSYESSYMLKFDANLNVVSQINYFLQDREIFAQSITAIADSKILITGLTVFNSNWSFFLLKTDTLGNIIWFKQYPQPIDAVTVRELSNGDIMVAGSFAYAFQFIQPIALRFDSSGNLIWAKIYIYAVGMFDNQNSTLEFIHDFGNGNILLAGRSDYSGIASLGFMDSYVLMVNNAGDIGWSKTFGEFQHDWAYDYAVSSNNQLVICGSTGSFFNYSNYGFVQVIDTSGSLVSSYAFGDTAAQEQLTLTGFREISGNKNMVIGFKTMAGLFNLFVTDYSAGNIGSCPVHPVSFLSSDASGYPVHSFSFVADSSLIPYTNSDSFSSYSGIDDSVLCASITSVDENSSLPLNQITVFPNPASELLHIQLLTKEKENTTVEVYNLIGEKVSGYDLKPGANALNVSGIAPGIYFLKFFSSSGIITIRKIMILS